MAEIKLVGLDVDGTLISSAENIPRENLEAISKAIKEKDVKFAIISGRISQSAKEYQDRLGAKGPVSSFGGCILEDEDMNILQEFSLDKETALTVIRLAKKYGITPLTYHRHNWYSDGFGEQKWFDSETAATNVVGTFVPSIEDFIENNNPNKFLAIDDNHEKLAAFEKELNELCKEKVKTYLSWPEFLEVMPPEADKGQAIKSLCKYWGFSKDEVMVVGDYYNDLAMFEQAGISVAVANAVDGVKEKATYVSSKTNAQGAVADAVYRFIFHKNN